MIFGNTNNPPHSLSYIYERNDRESSVDYINSAQKPHLEPPPSATKGK